MNSGQYLKDVKAQIRETDVEAVRKMVEARQGQGGRRQRRRPGPDRRAREGRVDRGLHPGRALDPARLPRAAHRGPGPGAIVGDRPLLRGRHALGAGGQVAGRARLHQRQVDGGRLLGLEARRAEVRPAVRDDARSRRCATRATRCCPRSARSGRPSCSSRRCCAWARAGSGSPAGSTWRRPASARSASSTTTWSTRRTCSGRSCTRPTGSACPRSSRRRSRSRKLNPDVKVIGAPDAARSSENVLDIIKDYDVIVDGADNFPTRYLLNDAALKLGKPVIHGSIYRFEGTGDDVPAVRRAPATAASIPSRRRPTWRRRARRRACSACCAA